MGHKRVLVVDDDAEIRNVLADFLTDEGFDVYTAGNGQEALDRARRIHPDCILMDINMPVLDGASASRRLKRDPETRSIKIFVMSARSLRNVRAGNTHVDGALIKPFDLYAVLDTVSSDGIEPRG